MTKVHLLNLLAEWATPALIGLVAWFFKDYIAGSRKVTEDFERRIRVLEAATIRHDVESGNRHKLLAEGLRELKNEIHQSRLAAERNRRAERLPEF